MASDKTLGAQVFDLIEAAYLEGWQACRHAADASGGLLPLTAHTWDDESFDCSRSKLAATALQTAVDIAFPPPEVRP